MKQHLKLISGGVVMACASLVFSGCTSCISNGRSLYNSVTPDSSLTERTFVLAPFSSIDSRTVVDVKVSQAEDQSVMLSAPTNYLQYIDVKVKEGVLTISTSKKVNLRKADMILTVTVPELKSVTTSGTGDIDFTGRFVAGDFRAVTSGTGDIEMKQFEAQRLTLTSSGTGDINYAGIAESASLNISGTGDIDLSVDGMKKIDASTTGTGDIDLKGSAASASLVTSGTGDVKATRLKAGRVYVQASGTGDIECYAVDEISGSVSGISHVKVKGNPPSRHVSGGKKVRFID